MSSFETLSALREQNKCLLEKMQKQALTLRRLVCPQAVQDANRKEMFQKMHFPDEDSYAVDNVVIKIHPTQARVARRKLQTRSPEHSPSRPEDTSELSVTREHPQQSTLANEGSYSKLLTHEGNFRPSESRKCTQTKNDSVHKRGTSLLWSSQFKNTRLTFHAPAQELTFSPDVHRLQPLLGYDWIAGLLDADNSLTDRSEQFFNDLREFRQMNREECVHSQCPGPSKTELEPSAMTPTIEETNANDTVENHQCTFCYQINNRLFAIPQDPQVGCPVCKMPKAKHPHTVSEPAFIRVSIPKSTVLPSYRYKAHRRCSFNPSDSLGLPSHCLSGWSNTAPSMAPHMSSLDLRSSMTSAQSTRSALMSCKINVP